MHTIHPIQWPDLNTAPAPVPRPQSTTGSRWAGVALAGLFVAGLTAGVITQGSDAAAASSASQTAAGATVRDLPLTRDRVEGIWFADGDPLTGTPALLARFDADGTVTLGGGSTDDALVVGTYQVHPTGVAITPTGGACEATETISWHTSMRAEGRLDVVNLGSQGALRQQVGDCSLRVGDAWHFNQVSPQWDAAHVLGGYRLPAGAVTEPAAARGYWAAPETGTVLSIGGRGRYTTYIGADVVDTGAVRLGGTSARFVSDGADQCGPSVAMTWQQVRIEDGQLRGTITQGGCTGGLTGDVSLVLLDTDPTRDALLPVDGGAAAA